MVPSKDLTKSLKLLYCSKMGMKPDSSIERVRGASLSGNKLSEAEAVGGIGWDRINDVLKLFRRDITVCWFTQLRGLRKITNRYNLKAGIKLQISSWWIMSTLS